MKRRILSIITALALCLGMCPPVSPGTFYAWSATAKGKRDECAEGKMTFDEFKKWLAES